MEDIKYVGDFDDLEGFSEKLVKLFAEDGMFFLGYENREPTGHKLFMPLLVGSEGPAALYRDQEEFIRLCIMLEAHPEGVDYCDDEITLPLVRSAMWHAGLGRGENDGEQY